MIKKILVVDDDVTRLRLNRDIQEYFDYFLNKENNYTFKIEVLDVHLDAPEKLWEYLDSENAVFPDFIFLDWYFKDRDQGEDGYTGEKILKELMKRKQFAHLEENESDISNLKKYKDLEVVVLSRFVKLPGLNNLEGMLLEGAISATTKDVLDTSNKSLVDYLNRWILSTRFGSILYPENIGGKHPRVDMATINAWLEKRDSIMNPKQYVETDLRMDELLNHDVYGPFFKDRCIGIPREKMKGGAKKYFNQYTSKIATEYLGIETVDTHLWPIIAIRHKLPFMMEYIKKI